MLSPFGEGLKEYIPPTFEIPFSIFVFVFYKPRLKNVFFDQTGRFPGQRQF
jgi:hypothetical protein